MTPTYRLSGLFHLLISKLTADDAISWAWRIWLALLAIPFAAFFAALWHSANAAEPGDQRIAEIWFIVTCIYLAIALPAALLWRSRLFQGYYVGKRVSPAQYLRGMVVVWVALSIAGVGASVGCLVTATLLPSLLPAGLALMLFITMWPNGHSMSRPLQNERDPAEYEDPR